MSKVAIITGASSGIGQGLAKLYAESGYSLGLIARRESKLHQLKTDLESSTSAKIMIGVCDVSNKSDIFSCIEGMIDHFGRVDVLVANAGVSLASPAYNSNADHLTETIEANVLGAGYSAYAVIPTMIQQKSGKIAVISSLAGYRGLPEAGVYCASKAAVNALFESMRLDLKKFKIGVSIIRPGYIKSPITDRNDFYMPFLQETDVGCKKIFNAIERKQKIFSFPWPLAIIVKTLYFWPCWLYDLCFAGVRNKKR
ncbi:3-ketoacyl-ACP reductase [Candidatus Marinamargulisbacteria bacterium SCGC AG-343-K17]|nr:3-ketoacyl-ACP reductase [Candidatus Marinamargulisbacteria bacterium SCGC AG-343-K17]